MNIGILLWNTCNAKCDHCAVSSGPNEKRVMSRFDILKIIDAAFYDCGSPSIGLSGGEAFLYQQELFDYIEYISKKGGRVSVNSNCFWAKTDQEADLVIQKVKKAGLSKLVVSTDGFHAPFIPQKNVVIAIQSCIKHHIEVELQFVASKKSLRLYDFLNHYGDQILNVSCREIPIHPVGRAEKFEDEDLFLSQSLPTGLCPSAIPSISASGKIIPCCNTAGHLPSLEYDDISGDIEKKFDRIKQSKLLWVMTNLGPAALLREMAFGENSVMEDMNRGFVDQCHLCYYIFKNIGSAEIAKKTATDMFDAKMEEYYFSEYKKNLILQNDTLETVNSAGDL